MGSVPCGRAVLYDDANVSDGVSDSQSATLWGQGTSDKNWTKNVGIYRICWCRGACVDDGEYQADAGRVYLKGPFTVTQQTKHVGQELKLNVRGILLSGSDR